MCGIAGVTWHDPLLIDRMTAMLAHRGPDQHGVYLDDHVSLGHRRLSIIDLSEHGRQPMGNEDGTLQVVFNGEIYNFAEVRRRLIDEGHKFRSGTDTEVIAHAYESYGPESVRLFNGMFAYAVWDSHNRRLVLVRDRLGIKPVYYSLLGDGELIFASEIKSILACDKVSRGINLQSVYEYLGYEFIPAPDTIFESIYKLPPAHMLVWHTGRGPCLTSYWQLDMTASVEPRRERERGFITVLEDSVRRQLVSDVPLGVFLSGGLDSSAIVAMMSRCGLDPINSFSLYYEDETFSELEYSRYMAKQYGTKHREILIEPISPELIETSIWHLDEPMTDLSTIPLYLLCRKVREYVTVCLSGEGGDEVLCGYDRFKASRLHRWYSLLPEVIRRHLIAGMMDRLSDRPQKKGLVNMLKRFIEGGLLPADGEHMRWQYFLPPVIASNLFRPEIAGQIDFDPFGPIRRYLGETVFTDRLARELYIDIGFTMPSSPLQKVDKMSMAHALEVRVPLLDHAFVEYCATVPSRWKLNGLETKSIFRTAMNGILPDFILKRGKQGYSFPIKNWLRRELKDYMLDMINSSVLIHDTFEMSCIHRLIDEHMQMRANHNHILWALINLAVWHRLFIEQNLAAAVPISPGGRL